MMDIILYSAIGLYAVCVAIMAYVVCTSRISDCILADKEEYNSMLMDDNY